MNQRIAIGATALATAAGALLVARADREPAAAEEPRPIVSVAPSVEPLLDVDGLELGPQNRAPEVIVLDAIEPAPTRSTPRPRPAPAPPTVATEPTPIILTSAELALPAEAPRAVARPASSRGSVRIDPRLDTAGGGARLGATPHPGEGRSSVGVYVGGGGQCPPGRPVSGAAGFVLQGTPRVGGFAPSRVGGF